MACDCKSGSCTRAFKAAEDGKPLPPSPRGAENCLTARTERYGIFAFNGGEEEEDETLNVRDIPRMDLLAQVARAAERYRQVLVTRTDDL